MAIKLDIGCGNARKAGHIGIDAFVEAPGITKALMWELPFKDGEVDEIHSSHALEHCSRIEVAFTLREWFRVMRHGGKLTLIVPDSIWFCENWLKVGPTMEKRDWHHATLFGLQDHPGEFHKCAFTDNLLASDLVAPGFRRIAISKIFDHGQGSLCATAEKP